VTASAAIDILLRRIRDPQAIGTSRADVLTILSHSQRLVNLDARLLMSEAPLTLTKRQVVYELSSVFSNAGRIEEVIFEGRRLDRMSLPQLVSYDRGWFRRTGPYPVAWSPLGRTWIAVYPATLDAPLSVTIKATLNIPDLASEASELSFADADEAATLDLAELLLLTRIRIIENLKPAVDRFATSLAEAGARGVLR
jgi:hypothetical protein